MPTPDFKAMTDDALWGYMRNNRFNTHAPMGAAIVEAQRRFDRRTEEITRAYDRLADAEDRARNASTDALMDGSALHTKVSALEAAFAEITDERAKNPLGVWTLLPKVRILGNDVNDLFARWRIMRKRTKRMRTHIKRLRAGQATMAEYMADHQHADLADRIHSYGDHRHSEESGMVYWPDPAGEEAERGITHGARLRLLEYQIDGISEDEVKAQRAEGSPISGPYKGLRERMAEVESGLLAVAKRVGDDGKQSNANNDDIAKHWEQHDALIADHERRIEEIKARAESAHETISALWTDPKNPAFTSVPAHSHPTTAEQIEDHDVRLSEVEKAGTMGVADKLTSHDRRISLAHNAIGGYNREGHEA